MPRGGPPRDIGQILKGCVIDAAVLLRMADGQNLTLVESYFLKVRLHLQIRSGVP